MKLFTKAIDQQLFKQYGMGSSMSQNVVVKIFNPYGRGYWYIMNSDPNDPDYLWGIVNMGYGPEVGSISRRDLESLRVRPFMLPLERDISFSPRPAKEIFQGLSEGKHYDEGGEVEESENKEMLQNKAQEISHHAKELENVVKEAKEVEPWELTKIQRAATDLSDITHYREGANKSYASGGMMATGGKVSDVSTYVSNREIKELKIVQNNKIVTVKGSDIIDGVYLKKSATSLTPAKSSKLSLSEFKEKYDENEDNNLHSDNVVLLAENFGTSQDVKDAKMILAKHESAGSLTSDLRKERDALSEKLWKIYLQESGKMAAGSTKAKAGKITGEFKDARYAKGKIAYHPPKNSGRIKSREMRLAEAKGVRGRWSNREKAYIMSKSQAEKLKKYLIEGKDAEFITHEVYGKGGKVKFEDKVASIKASLLKREKVSPSVQKDYGKTYSPKEAEESAKRIAGAMRAKGMK